MRKLFNKKPALVVVLSLIISGCGDFPDYGYDQSDNYCVMSFPFAGGIIGRQYVGYFRVISTLQYMDADPEIRIIVTGPSHIELEPGSFQKLVMSDKAFKPKFVPDHLEAELQLWGPSFLFEQQQSDEIYALLQDGYDLNIHGRIEVGHQYETQVHNFFFGSAEEELTACVNRLLNEDDLKQLQQQKKQALNNQQKEQPKDEQLKPEGTEADKTEAGKTKTEKTETEET